MEKTVITVVGKDAVGILYKCSEFLYQHNVNIKDIAQTVLDGFFNMMMIVDVAGIDQSFESFAKDMKEMGSQMGVDIRCQKEEIFDMMHRI
ncbi:MAG: ACT domain-containing protein [Bacteroidales bacterium]|nr:ACT domain-containing protein [Bacteroidales bacterium]